MRFVKQTIGYLQSAWNWGVLGLVLALVGMVLTVLATDQVQTTTPTAAIPLDTAALSKQILASVGAPTIAPKPAEVSAAERGKITNTLAKLPLSFEPNRGQSAPEVRFLTRAPGYLLQLTATEMRLIVRGASEHPGRTKMPPPSENSTVETATPKTRPHALKLTWLNANRNAEVAPESPLTGTANYFKGSESSKWHTNIPTFARVRYKEIYPGIDLVYYGNRRQLEYDLIVAPGADPTPARLTVQGAEVSLTDKGDLDLTLSDGRRLQLRALVAHQERDGERLMVEAHYRLSRQGDTSEIAFQLAAYDPERPLIIDPLVYSTFLGGSAQDGRGWGIAVNAAGEAFVTGETDSTDFPTTAGAFDTTYNGGQDAFVTRVNAAGSALVYSTFLGGGGIDRGLGIAVTAAGEAFLTGQTQGGFPTTPGAFDTTHNGGFNDAFVAKLNAAGSALVYSTYLGGSGSDVGWGIAVTAAGEAFVTGDTHDGVTDFPTTPGAFDTTQNGHYDAFVAKLNAAGSALVYSTFLGGSFNNSGYFNDGGIGIAVNAAGEAFVTGETDSIDFPTTAGAFDTTYNGGITAFVTRVNAAGSALVYSTLLGDSTNDIGYGIAVNAADEAFVTGVTFASGTDFPTTPGAFRTVSNGGPDAFVTRVNAAGSALVYSTFLGGSGSDTGTDIALTAAGEAFVIGSTGSTDFPTTAGAFDTTQNGSSDVFVTRVNAAGSALVYSTFLGGSGSDEGDGIAITAACDAFVTGGTENAVTDFPTTAVAFDTTHNGGPSDAFVAKIATGPCCVPPPSGMVAWWPLDEQPGANIIQDILGFDNNGTSQPGSVGPPAAGPMSVPGQVNGALYFVNNYIDVPPATNLNLANSDLTIDGWFAWGLPGSPGFGGIPNWSPGQTIYDAIVDKLNPSTTPNSGYALFVRTQATPLPSPPQTGNPVTITVELVFALGNNLYTAQIYSGTTTFPPPSGQYPPPTPPWPYGGQWLHVAVTVDRSTGIGTFYLNGNSVGNFTPAAGVNNTAPLWIGKSRLPVNGMEFALDEIEIFNRPLNPTEIHDIYNAGSAGKCKKFVNLAITPSSPTTNPFDVTYAVRGCSGQEMFLVLDASAAPNAVPGLVPFPLSYLDTSGAWQPWPTPLSLITPWMSSGPADGLYTLFSGSVPTGQYTLYLGCDFVPNGHLDIDANLNVNGVYDALNVTVQ